MTPNIVSVETMVSVNPDQDPKGADRLRKMLQQFVGAPNTEEMRQKLLDTITQFYSEPNMVFKLSAYRVDWPPEAGVGRTRFYGVDDSARMEMHLQHGANFEPKTVALFEQVVSVPISVDTEVSKDTVKNQVFIDYTNYRGERAWRLIDCAASTTRFGTSEYHTEPQWLMKALDVAKGEEREFAMKDIHETRKVVTTEMG